LKKFPFVFLTNCFLLKIWYLNWYLIFPYPWFPPERPFLKLCLKVPIIFVIFYLMNIPSAHFFRIRNCIFWCFQQSIWNFY